MPGTGCSFAEKPAVPPAFALQPQRNRSRRRTLLRPGIKPSAARVESAHFDAVNARPTRYGYSSSARAQAARRIGLRTCGIALHGGFPVRSPGCYSSVHRREACSLGFPLCGSWVRTTPSHHRILKVIVLIVRQRHAQSQESRFRGTPARDKMDVSPHRNRRFRLPLYKEAFPVDLVGTCTVCRKPVYCKGGFLDGVVEHNSLYCHACFETLSSEDKEEPKRRAEPDSGQSGS